MTDLVPIPSGKLDRAGFERLPAAIARAGDKAAWRFIEFFTANIRNKNTRAAYAQALQPSSRNLALNPPRVRPGTRHSTHLYDTV